MALGNNTERSKQLGAAILEIAKMSAEDDDFLKVSSSHSVFNEDVEPALCRPIDFNRKEFSLNDKLVKHQDDQLAVKFSESFNEMAIYAMQSADIDFKGIVEDIQSGDGVVFLDLEDLNKARKQITEAGIVLHGSTVQLSLVGYPSEVINAFDIDQLTSDKLSRKQFYLAFVNVSGSESLGTTHMKRRVYVDY